MSEAMNFKAAYEGVSEMTQVERDSLLSLLRTGGLTGPHLEIGTAAGCTLCEMMLAYPSDARPPFVVVDTFTYFPDHRGIVERNLRTAGIDPAAVTLRAAPSYQAVSGALAAGEQYDFILIDARHDAWHVMQDLTWARTLRPGGYLAFHDYSSRCPGVIWAADAFARAYPNYTRVSLAGTLLVMRKERESLAPEVSALHLARAFGARLRHRIRKWMSRQGLTSAAQ